MASGTKHEWESTVTTTTTASPTDYGSMQDATDLQMIRHLARKYTFDQLARLIAEEGRDASMSEPPLSISPSG